LQLITRGRPYSDKKKQESMSIWSCSCVQPNAHSH